MFSLLLAMMLCLLVSCDNHRGKPERSPRPNFIVIVVDTLRADHLHYAGYPKNFSPHFDALQAESVWFSNAYAPCSWTLPSVISLFLSQHSSTHGKVSEGSRLSPEQTTFIERLQAAGYRTGGWTANRLMSTDRGLDRGFDQYRLLLHPEWWVGIQATSKLSFAPASLVTERAIAWLRRDVVPAPHVPFFAYLHYMEPHTPYLCPDIGGQPCREAAAKITQLLLSYKWEFTPSQLDLLKGFYAADVARMDAALGDLFAELEAISVLDNTWVILTSDHGELLGEHGMYVHGNTLYQPALRIPLLIRPPSREGLRVDAPVSLIDLAPTILDLAGIAVPPSFFAGRSLRTALEGGSISPRPIVAELFPLSLGNKQKHRHRLAVMDGEQKILLRTDGELERFDLVNDPDEEAPLPASNAELQELLRASEISFDLSKQVEPNGPEASPEMLQHLRALGYID
jgi:arylsulfatase A-like enzyme